MKKLLAFLSLAAALTAASGCAQAPATGKNDQAKRFFDAWSQTYYPNAEKTYLGSVILGEEAGTGELIGSNEETPYVYCTVTSTDLSGNVNSTTDKKLAQQIGTYSESNYYGPHVLSRAQGRLFAGLIELMQTMREGGSRTAAVPGWLLTYDIYDTPEEYVKNCTGTDAIYSFKVHEGIKDIVKWEIDSLSRYMHRHYPRVDSTAYGYYYIRTAEPLDTNAFESSSTVYINYTGRLLNGQVFDSTVQDTAKVHRIWQDSKTYEPVSLTWPTDDNKVTFSSGSDMIEGFEKCIHAMRAGEKGVCIFYSGLGYGLSGSGNLIPGISPLIFEVQMLGLNEDGSIDES